MTQEKKSKEASEQQICPRCMKDVNDKQVRCFNCGFMLIGEDGYLRMKDLLPLINANDSNEGIN